MMPVLNLTLEPHFFPPRINFRQSDCRICNFVPPRLSTRKNLRRFSRDHPHAMEQGGTQHSGITATVRGEAARGGRLKDSYAISVSWRIGVVKMNQVGGDIHIVGQRELSVL
jgi:hypothetical protein